MRQATNRWTPTSTIGSWLETPVIDGSSNSSEAPAEPLLQRGGFLAYLGCLGTFWLPGGILGVLFPWLIAVQLGAPAQQLGLAQMALQLPTLVLVLFGGVLADRRDPRRILLAVHLCAALPPLTLALLLSFGHLNLAMLIGYAVASGTCAALGMPARDSLLTSVAGDQIQRAVGLTMALQFGAQIAGFTLASRADQIGAVPLLLLMSAVFAMGAAAVLRLPSRATPATPAVRGPGDLLGGITESLRSSLLWPPMLLAFGTGIFFAGSFVVLLPLFIRDVYGGGAGGIGASFICFMVGTLVSILIQVRRPILRQGRALILSQIIGGAVLATLALELPLQGFLAAMFCWGLCGGVGMVTSRSMVQAAAPESHRGRVLGVYAMTSFGGMPIGSLALGFIIALLGPLHAVLVPAGAMILLAGLVALTSSLWRQRTA
ncbi:MAG: MFS transporter [Gammaproteobacteria bacterium]|nr:MFS transporter [Gammaproteobacteria bacterium]